MVITSRMIAYCSYIAAKQIGMWYDDYKRSQNNKKK